MGEGAAWLSRFGPQTRGEESKVPALRLQLSGQSSPTCFHLPTSPKFSVHLPPVLLTLALRLPPTFGRAVLAYLLPAGKPLAAGEKVGRGTYLGGVPLQVGTAPWQELSGRGEEGCCSSAHKATAGILHFPSEAYSPPGTRLEQRRKSADSSLGFRKHLQTLQCFCWLQPAQRWQGLKGKVHLVSIPCGLGSLSGNLFKKKFY